MQGLAAKASLLDIATVANDIKSSKGSENFIESNQNLNDDSPSSQGDFLSSLLSAIDETNEFLPDRLKISDKEISAEIIANIEKNSNFFGFSSENNEMSIFESLSFMEVLGVLEKLKIKSTDVKLSNLSNLTQQFLQSESNFNALKGAKNLSELLDIAKGLDLNVSNIKIDRILDLKNTFPNLDKAGFFNHSLESAFKDIINTKISNIVDKIEKKDKNTNVNLSNKNSKDILAQALKLTEEKVKTKDSKDKKIENLDNNDLLKLDTKNQTIKDTKVENLITDNETVTKNTNDKTNNKFVSDGIKKENLQEIKTNVKKDELSLKDDSQKIKENISKEVKINENIKTEDKDEVFNKIQVNKEASKDILKENTNNLQQNNELKNENSKIKTQNLDTNITKNLVKQDEKQELKFDSADKNLPLSKDEKIDDKINNKQNTNTKQDNIKQAYIENTKLSLQTTQVKAAEKVVIDTSTLKNTKQEINIKESDITDKKLEFNTNINQNKINLNLTNSNLNNNLDQQNSQNQNQNKKEIITNNNTKEHNTDAKSDVKYNTNELNNLVSTLSKISTNEFKANLNIKETFSYFANDLKEQMQQFKAPITRLNITLNPSNLGEVEVTLIQRGSALHINFNSNPNTMALFVQNQAEFKNSLVNMGFTGLEMNFSDQKQKEQKEQTSKNKNSYKASGDFAINEPTQSPLELILAKYF